MRDVNIVTVGGIALAIIIVMFVVAEVVSIFCYQSDVFEAKVESIEYYHTGSLLSSATKVIVEFDNGIVVDVWEVPKVLRVGETYIIDYRTPYYLKDSYLVVVKD